METRYPLHNLTEKLHTVEPLHNGHHGDRRKWPLWRGGRYGEVGVQYDNFFREYNMFVSDKFVITVSNSGNLIINNI